MELVPRKLFVVSNPVVVEFVLRFEAVKNANVLVDCVVVDCKPVKF